MKILRVAASFALLLTACSGYVGVGWWGWYWDYPCYDPYYPYCDYYYKEWTPDSVAAADFEDDGALDLAVADGAAGSVWYVKGRPGGDVATPSVEITLPSAAARLTSFRANLDARPDLLLLDGESGALTTYLADGAGGFTRTPSAPLSATTLRVVRFARGDLDADGLDDLVVLDDSGALHVALGTGSGTFLRSGDVPFAAGFPGADAASRRDGVFLALAEFDDRPGTDLVVVDGVSARIAVLSGLGDGSFAEPRTIAFGSMGDVLDVAPFTRGSGWGFDLAVLFGDRADPLVPTTLVVLRLADGSPVMDPLGTAGARALFSADPDGDGRTELLLADPASRTITTVRAAYE